MNLVTLNMRGIGNSAKNRRFRSLIRERGIDFCFIQETKRSNVDNKMVARLWSGDDFEWVAQSSVGLSDDILSIWRKGMFNFLFSFSQPGYVGVAIKQGTRNIYFVNVYSGC